MDLCAVRLPQAAIKEVTPKTSPLTLTPPSSSLSDSTRTLSRSRSMPSLKIFSTMASAASAKVINSYSTSFSLATRLLDSRTRKDIQHLYAVVRIADEIVDGAGQDAGLSHEEIAATLDEYERQVLSAPKKNFHTDPILHAYGQTARECGFKEEHLKDFFAAMRADLHHQSYNAKELQDYIHGSAEVIGLLCLDIFLRDETRTEAERAELEAGAVALGSAFQKINFLRDMAADRQRLGRDYYPGLDAEGRRELIHSIRGELDRARAAMPLLPPAPRRGVGVACALFAEVLDKLVEDPGTTTRVRVPNLQKLLIVVQELSPRR